MITKDDGFGKRQIGFAVGAYPLFGEALAFEASIKFDFNYFLTTKRTKITAFAPTTDAKTRENKNRAATPLSVLIDVPLDEPLEFIIM